MKIVKITFDKWGQAQGIAESTRGRRYVFSICAGDVCAVFRETGRVTDISGCATSLHQIGPPPALVAAAAVHIRGNAGTH
jgi:hypothetical protein